MRKKYLTEEERIAARRERVRKYAENNPEKCKERVRKWKEENPDKVKEYVRKWQKENPDKVKESCRKWYETNSDKAKEIVRKYQSTPIGRASLLVNNYRRNDKKYNRGECTLTADWIINNIFTSKCIYCGETDWTELGCDRINNDLPHTPDNVVVCCEECNKKRGNKSFEEFLAKKNMFR